MAAVLGFFIDSNPLFFVSFAIGALVIAWCATRKPDFLTAWVLIFFASALVIFFAGSARYFFPWPPRRNPRGPESAVGSFPRSRRTWQSALALPGSITSIGTLTGNSPTASEKKSVRDEFGPTGNGDCATISNPKEPYRLPARKSYNPENGSFRARLRTHFQ